MTIFTQTLRRGARLAVAIFTLALSATTAAHAAKGTRVNLATLAPSGTSFHLALQEMGQVWKDAPDGGIRLVIFPDGRMGDEGDVIRKIRPANGQLQAALVTIVGLVDIDPDVSGLQNIPMAYRSLEEASYVRSQLAPKLEARMADKGFIVLGWCDSGWWRMFTVKEVLRPEDLKGEKMIITAGSTGLAKLVSALGMQPVELNPTDMLVSLRTGLITVAPVPPIYALQGQLYQPAPHMLELNWLPLVGALVLKKDVWDKLTPAQQAVARSSGEAAMQKVTDAGRREMQESIDAMVKRGLQVHAFSGEAQERWISFFEDVQQQARGTLVPEASFDEIMALLKAYRAKK